MAGGWLGGGVCHPSPELAATAACASMHGPTSAGLAACTGAVADPDGQAVLTVATAPASGPGYTSSMAVQLQPCARISVDELGPIMSALLGVAVLLATMARLPRLFEARTYGSSDP